MTTIAMLSRQSMPDVTIDPLLARIKNRIAPPQPRVLPAHLIV